MQILLTEEEYNALKAAPAIEREKMVPALQDLCTKVANHMPVKWGWTSWEEKKPWGCMLTAEHEWYCDSCPVQSMCPCKHKEFSK